ncbi:MAG: uracil-DNA glycosylase [Planctomycetota bacterium]|nr:uracil-DNA glycosylase [Planctomycetota bacterium]
MAKTSRTVRIQFFSEYLLASRISSCKKCPRLAEYLAEHREKNPDWYCMPVPGFGDPNAKIVLLGLAPGLKGANRTGRPFTGDAAGIWLYRILFQRGFCNNEESISRDDNTGLRNIYIANVVKCVPPGNKPTGEEVNTCSPFLQEELKLLDSAKVVVCFGKVAHDAYFKIRKLLHPELKGKDFPFGHAAVHEFEGAPQIMLDSFHPSRLNTNTGRLTWEMWEQVFEVATELAK